MLDYIGKLTGSLCAVCRRPAIFFNVRRGTESTFPGDQSTKFLRKKHPFSCTSQDCSIFGTPPKFNMEPENDGF